MGEITIRQAQVGTKPKPLCVMDNGRISKYSCHGEALKTIPQSVSKLNVIWATKRLDEIQDRKKRKDKWEKKKNK